MTAIPGSVRFTGFVAPSDSGDTYAVTDDTYHRGGFRPVANTAARDAITEDRRKVGMLVYSIADDKYYRCTVATSPPTWVEASMGGSALREGVGELVDAARTVLPADNRLFLESDATGSVVTPVTMTIDQAEFSLVDDEGWQVTFRVGNNDNGDPVPVYAACTTSEMSVDDATFITSLYCAELGGQLTVRYAYAGADRGRFTVVAGRGLWTDDLTGKHYFSGSAGASSILLEADTIDLVDDTDFSLLEDPLAVIKGTGYLLTVTPTTGTGLLTVELYQDAARLVVVKTMSVDLTDATTFVDFEAFGFDLETDGTIYGTAFVSGVGGSETFDIALNAIALTVSASPAPLPWP
jgi:hypothetical protein